LASLGLTQIDISLQTPDEASFHATRGTKMDFKIYRERVIELLAASRNIPNPPIFKIRVMTTGLARKLRAQLGIPDFTNSSEALHRVVEEWVSPVYEALHMDIRRFLPRELRRARIYAWNVIEIAPKVFIETYVLTDWGNAFSGAGIIPANRGWCFGMRDHFAVMYNGDVTLCCVDYEGRTSLGNLSTSSIEEILGNPESARIIRGLRKGRLLHEHCRNCLGSHSTLGSWTKPTMSFVGLELLKPFFYRTYRVYS
jgi:radical SAM protein with 4Fe4S-binding SPASM domain